MALQLIRCLIFKVALSFLVEYLLNNYWLLPILILVALTACKPQGGGHAPLSEDYSSTVPVPAPDVIEPFPNTKEEQLAVLVSFFKNKYSASFDFEVGFRQNIYFNGDGILRVVGVCEIYSDGTKKVLFNELWWSSAGYTAKKVLVLHEMGHCYFNRNHDSHFLASGIPRSLMYPIIDPIVSAFPLNDLYYLEELKSSVISQQPNIGYSFKTDVEGICDSY